MNDLIEFYQKQEISDGIGNTFQKFVDKYKTIQEKIAPNSLKRCLTKKYLKYRFNNQEDAQEFIAELLDALEEDLPREQKEFSRYIDSIQESTSICPKCNRQHQLNH